MSDETTTVGGYPRGLRLSNAQDQTLRRWPLDRIRPKAVALGVRSLIAEVDALRERAAALEGAGNDMAEQSVRCVEFATATKTAWYECRLCQADGWEPGSILHDDECAVGRWDAALAQADDGGRS